MQTLNVNANKRGTTIISQSFIASEFQAYNDPFTKSDNTFGLHHLTRSKQNANSGFIPDTEIQAFGFGNITQQNEPKNQQIFSRKTNNYGQEAASQISENTKSQFTSSTQNRFISYSENPAQQYQNLYAPQQANQRYLSPNVLKNNLSPSINEIFQQNIQRGNNQFNLQQNYGQKSRTQGFQSQSQAKFRPDSYSTEIQLSHQLASSQHGSSQMGASQMSSSSKFMNQNNDISSGIRVKLNVSQQFSNSFVLKCVNEPQKSSILSMKQRQREFRKSIQGYFI